MADVNIGLTGAGEKAPPLTLDNVLKAVEGVENWERLGEWFLDFWSIDSIKRQHDSDEACLKAVVEKFLLGEGLYQPSWRSMIHILDGVNEVQLADKIRSFGEPVQDPTLTTDNVAQVMELVNKWESLSDPIYPIIVPPFRLSAIQKNYSTKSEISTECASYYVHCYPEPSWTYLATRLYNTGEFAAVEKLKPFLPLRDPTITTKKVNDLFSTSEDKEVDYVGFWLQLPESKRSEIKRKYHSPAQRREAYIDIYVNEHPHPTWKRLCLALRMVNLPNQADEVERTYVQVEEKPLVVPVKTEVKEEAVIVTKDEITSAQPTAAWDLCGVEVCGEMTVVVHSSGAQQITWEGFGLKLHIDEGSLPAGIHQCTLTIKSSLAGQYEFPDNSYLVSAIFWLRCEPMFKFTKPVTVEMQHCARSENVANLKLKFVRAVCSQKQLPYTFKEVGGDFTRHSSYGVVEVNGFSGLAITQEGSSECNYLTNLLSKEVIGHPTRVIVEIFFVVIRKMDSHRTVMLSHDHFKDAKLMTYQPIAFESDCVEFEIKRQSESRNWKINKLNSSIVKKEDVDSFTLQETSWIPHSHFKAKYVGDLSVIQDLECAVNIIGARQPHNSLTIDISPEGPVSNLQLSGPSPPALQTSDPVPTRLSSVHVSFLSLQLYQHSAKWRDIGIGLGFTQGELDTIQASPSLHASAPNSWLTKMLAEWLQWAPGDGRGSTHFATLEKLKDALKQANLGATAQTLHL